MLQNLTRRIARKSNRTGFTLVEIMIVVLIIGILLAIAIPNFVQARESSRAKACVANLKQLDSAKQQYMMDKNVSTFTSVVGTNSSTDTYGGLVTQYVRSAPLCPAGGTYTSGDGRRPCPRAAWPRPPPPPTASHRHLPPRPAVSRTCEQTNRRPRHGPNDRAGAFLCAC